MMNLGGIILLLVIGTLASIIILAIIKPDTGLQEYVAIAQVFIAITSVIFALVGLSDFLLVVRRDIMKYLMSIFSVNLQPYQ